MHKAGFCSHHGPNRVIPPPPPPGFLAAGKVGFHFTAQKFCISVRVNFCDTDALLKDSRIVLIKKAIYVLKDVLQLAIDK